MFAIVRTGGKQYRVAAGDKIVVDKIDGEAGARVPLGDVLLAGDGGELKDVGGLEVAAEIVAQAKGEKIVVFKKRRRHNYRRKNGHRQDHTILKILSVGGETERKQEAVEAAPVAEEPAVVANESATVANEPAGVASDAAPADAVAAEAVKTAPTSNAPAAEPAADDTTDAPSVAQAE